MLLFKRSCLHDGYLPRETPSPPPLHPASPSVESTLASVYLRKKLTHLPEPTPLHMLWLSHLAWVDPTRPAMFILIKTGPAKRVTLQCTIEKGWPFLTCGANFLFCYVNGLPRFVRKCMKSWLAQGSSGGRVTPLHRTAFLSMIQVKIKFRLKLFLT